MAYIGYTNYTPSTATSVPTTTASGLTTLTISLSNQTASSTVYAYVTGSAVSENGALFLLEADGETPYYPSSPSSSNSPLGEDCAIPLGSPGSTTQITIPQITNGRVWFSVDSTLTFSLNPGPLLATPSAANSSDANYTISWDFCEFTFTTAELYANLTYVDFVCLPISLQLTNTSGNTSAVAGIPQDGLDTICSNLQAQDAVDGAGWGQLVITQNDANLRALSPNNGINMNSSLFSGYFEPFVNAVWSRYTDETLTIDTQDTWGNISGQVSNGVLDLGGAGTWSMPSTADIFSCSTGPFQNTAGEAGNVSARLAAGFNRSTLLLDDNEPDNEVPSTYYQTSPTNHYARIVHAANLDGEGYAFPYDDVGPPGGPDLVGAVTDPSPQLLTITVGGGSVTPEATTRMRRKRFMEVENSSMVLPKLHRRRADWSGIDNMAISRDTSFQNIDLEKRGLEKFMVHQEAHQKPAPRYRSRDSSLQSIDLEKGGSEKLLVRHDAHQQNEPQHRPALKPYLQRLVEDFSRVSPNRVHLLGLSKVRLTRLQNFPMVAQDSRLRPITQAINTTLMSFVSASAGAVLSRAFVILVVLLFYLVAGKSWDGPVHQERNRLVRVGDGLM